MKYLVKTVETWRVDTEDEVDAFVEQAKNDDKFQLLKYDCTYKEVKSKGEILETYYQLALTKGFNDIKDPDTNVEVVYEVD